MFSASYEDIEAYAEYIAIFKDLQCANVIMQHSACTYIDASPQNHNGLQL
jgi:hypothetical protein